MKIPEKQVNNEDSAIFDDLVIGVSLCLLLFCFLLFRVIFTLLFWASFFLLNSHRHCRKLDKNQDWSHQDLLQKPHCLWPPARVTGKITGSLDSSSSSPHPLCSMAAIWHQRRWERVSTFSRLFPLLPLKCGRVHDVSISSSAILPFLHAKNAQRLTTEPQVRGCTEEMQQQGGLKQPSLMRENTS